jgi:hypothetical protein
MDKRFRERVEDPEDARDLEVAIVKNGDKPLVPWEQAKKELGIESAEGACGPQNLMKNPDLSWGRLITGGRLPIGFRTRRGSAT